MIQMAEAEVHVTAKSKRNMFQLMGVLAEMRILDVDTVRQEVQDILSAIAILAALILTMVQVDKPAKQTYKDPWLSCEHFPCLAVHSFLSVLALALAVLALMSSTTTYVFFTLAGKPKTAKYTHCFPQSFFVPFWSLKLGLFVWLIDMYWLALLTHGARMMLLVAALPAVSLTYIAVLWESNQRWVLSEMRDLAGAQALFDPSHDDVVIPQSLSPREDSPLVGGEKDAATRTSRLRRNRGANGDRSGALNICVVS